MKCGNNWKSICYFENSFKICHNSINDVIITLISIFKIHAHKGTYIKPFSRNLSDVCHGFMSFAAILRLFVKKYPRKFLLLGNSKSHLKGKTITFLQLNIDLLNQSWFGAILNIEFVANMRQVELEVKSTQQHLFRIFSMRELNQRVSYLWTFTNFKQMLMCLRLLVLCLGGIWIMYGRQVYITSVYRYQPVSLIPKLLTRTHDIWIRHRWYNNSDHIVPKTKSHH